MCADWQRFYLGYDGRFKDDCVLELQGGLIKVALAQAPSAKTKVHRGGPRLDKAADPSLTGTTVWDGSVALAHFLTETNALQTPSTAPLRPPQLPAEQPVALLTSSNTEQPLHGQQQAAAAGTGYKGAPMHQQPTSTASPLAASASQSTTSHVFTLSPSISLLPTSEIQSSLGCTTAATYPSGSPLPHVLELGAGCGGVSLALAACRLAASVTITDLPDMLPHIRLNVQRNATVLQAGPDDCNPYSRRSAVQHGGFCSSRGVYNGSSRQGRVQQRSDMNSAANAPAWDDELTTPRTADTAHAASATLPGDASDLAAAAAASPGVSYNTSFPRQRLGGPVPVKVAALTWRCQADVDALRPAPPAPPYHDVIVGSDLIYYTYSSATPHTQLLLWTLEALSGPGTVIFLSLSLHHNPAEVESFLSLAAEGAFVVERLHELIPDRFQVPDVTVVRMRLKGSGL